MIPRITLILDSIRSVENVASIFRTADSAGIAHIVLCGITPGPLDRFNNPRKDFAKVSLGSENSVVWSRADTVEQAIAQFREESVARGGGGLVLALEQSPNSVSYTTPTQATNIAIIIGTERNGLDQNVLNLVDAIYEIPQYGKKESLNVAVATGILVYALRQKRSI